MSKLCLILMTLVLSSCAIFGTQQVRHHKTTSLVGFLYPDGEIPADLESPVLRLPLRVGLAFIPESGHETINPRLKMELLDSIKQSFENHRYVSSIEIIPAAYLNQGNGTDQLTQIKQLYQLDVMALVSFDQIVNRQENLLAVSYLTIVGAYIFPGSKYDVSTLIDLAVIDLGSKRLLFRAAGSHGSNGAAPEAYTAQKYNQHQTNGFQLAMLQLRGNLGVELVAFEDRLRQQDPNDDIQVVNKPGFSMSTSWALIWLLTVVGGCRFFIRRFTT